jgi:RNA polymerase sigma-70 factor (sigma-E family)
VISIVRRRQPHHPRDSAFEEFVRTQRPALVRYARLLNSGDGHLAEDLVQQTLTKLYLAWSRLDSTDVNAYARRALVNTMIDHSRRTAVRRERVSAVLPDVIANDPTPAIDPDLVAAIGRLPLRMRSAVILRHVEGLTVEETAEILGCSVGTVKSQTARGLDKLRAALAADPSEADSPQPLRVPAHCLETPHE